MSLPPVVDERRPGVAGLLTFGVGADCAAGAWLCVGVDGRLVPGVEGSVVPVLAVAQVALSAGDVCMVDPVTGRAWRAADALCGVSPGVGASVDGVSRACGPACWCPACVEAMGGRAEAERVRVVCAGLEESGSVGRAGERSGVGVSRFRRPASP